MKANRPVTMEKTIRKSTDRVWRALTNAKALSKWFFEVPDFKAEVGFEFRIVGQNEGISYPSTCIVTQVEEGKLLRFSWSFDDLNAITYVSIEIVAEGQETLLKLTHSGLENLPQDHPHFKMDNFVLGWQYFLGRLDELLDTDQH